MLFRSLNSESRNFNSESQLGISTRNLNLELIKSSRIVFFSHISITARIIVPATNGELEEGIKRSIGSISRIKDEGGSRNEIPSPS